MNNKTRILKVILVAAALASIVYCAPGALSPNTAYAAPAPAPVAAPATQNPAPPAPAQAPAATAAKPVPPPVVVPAEPEEEHKGFPWVFVGLAIALAVILVGYYKSKGEGEFDRTKFLAFVFAGLAVVAVFFYGGKYISKEPQKTPKRSIVMAPPKPRPATPAPAPAAASPAAPAPYVPVIKVTEKGREVQYGSPEDFIARTSLSPSEAGAFAERHLADAKKADEAARKKGDNAQMEHAQADLKLAENLLSQVRRSAAASPGARIVPYVSLGKRDPFMSPLEVPKVFPLVPPNAPPLERVPAESIVVKAIVWSAKGFRALVITPDGRGYTVKLGDRMGNKGGRIVKISEKRVYVTEKIRDILGDIETRDIVLKLYKEAE